MIFKVGRGSNCQLPTAAPTGPPTKPPTKVEAPTVAESFNGPIIDAEIDFVFDNSSNTPSINRYVRI